MMKSMLLTTSRHSNIQYTTLAYRTLFLLSFLLFNLGGVRGQTVKSETLETSWLNGQSVTINKVDEIFNLLYDGKDWETGLGVTWNRAVSFSKNWYAHWYITDANNVRQSIVSGAPQNESWAVTTYQDSGTDQSGWWKTSNTNKTVWCDHQVRPSWQDGWPFTQIFVKNTLISVPNGKTLSDFSGYKIVLEVATNNPNPSQNEGNIPPNSLPSIDLQYIFEIPEGDDFLGTAKNPNAKGSFNKEFDDENIGTYTFTLDGVYSDDIRYARIVLCDATGKAVDYDANILKVTYKGTDAKNAGSWSTNGVYVYDNGATLAKENISITLSAGSGKMNQYSIKCFLAQDDPANSTQSGNVENGIVTKEPNWDYEYTYSFTYPVSVETIYKTLDQNILNGQVTEITIQRNEYLSFFGYGTDYNSMDNFAKSWYARWYVVEDTKKLNNKEPIASTKQTLDDTWAITHWQVGNEGNGAPEDNWPTSEWNVSNNMVWSGNSVSSNTEGGWFIRDVVANHTQIAVPNGKTFDDFGSYRIVFEITNENSSGAPNSPPAVKLRFVFEIPESDQFLNKAKAIVKEGTGSKDIPKSNTSASFTLNDVKNSGYTQDVKYTRIQLCDIKGKVLEYDENLLTVTYKGNAATKAGTKKTNGVYVYDSGNKLDLSEVNITLNAGFGNLNKYTIKCLLSSDEMPNASKEPEWDYKYSYWFNYIIETKEIPETVAWKQNGMMPVASTIDLNKWNTSWEELSLGIYAKWYVVDSNNPDVKETLGAYQGSRVENMWTIDPARFDVSDNEAVQQDKSTLTSTFMSTIYAPAGMEFDNVKDRQIIFEIYTYNNITLERNPSPNARYTFTLYDDFLGELTDKDKHGSKIEELDNKGITEYSLSLSEATTAYSTAVPNHADIKFARVWLTRTDGTLVDPTDRLQIEAMNLYGDIEGTDPTFGYYLAGDNMNLGSATLKLPLATYNQYQVHVALSTDTEFDIQTHEPDYDYLFTFSFSYPAKTKYKTLIYDATNNQCTPHLLQNWMEVAGDCNEGLSNLNDKLYVRWYLVDVASNAVVQLGNAIDGYQQANNLGYYKLGGFNFATGNYKHTLNTDKIPTITLPTEYKGTENYKNVQLVCVATTKTDDYNTNPSWVADPSEIQVKYVYTLKTEDELQSQPFVHYQGEAYRYQIDMLGMTENSEEAKKFDYDNYGTSPNLNYTWDIATNSYKSATGSIRQKVHTVDYYYYVKTSDTAVELQLPLQYYDDKGNDTEPKAYYRWYDYNTDEESEYLNKVGFLLNINAQKEYDYDGLNKSNLTQNSGYSYYTPIHVDSKRGLFALNIASQDKVLKYKVQNDDNEKELTFVTNPSHSTIGVTFDASRAFGGSSEDEIVIACDVSRYLDGMDESFTYLVHEPTLSIRYLFHILPASEIVAKIQKAGSLASVENKIKANEHPTDILEYEGRIVVSTNNGVGDFSLRTQLNDLKRYYIDATTPATRIWWYAYYKDSKGNWWRHLLVDKDYLDENNEKVKKDGDGYVQRSEMHQDKYSLEDLKGTWTRISGTGGTAPTEIEVGDRVQMVACIGTGETANITNDKPIIWTELEFIDAKPMVLGSETDERSEGSMNREYGDPTVLGFNEFSLLGTTKPTNSYENYATVPLEFGTAQYGFSYPQLYGLCATNWTTNWAGYGISPVHGDYILLKSMNMPGISFDENWNEQSIFCNWWNSNSQQPLLDVTNERANGKFVTEGVDYGGFLYVDAADEARTIATLQFDAALCHSAKIYYTAYIASMTGPNDKTGDNQTPPMLRFRVTTYDEDKEEYVPVVTFVTGDIQQEVRADDPTSFKQSQWYQVYGYTTIPSELDYLLKNGDPRTYYVEIDNYCDNTNGADYCVDQISFYTTNTKLKVRQVGKQCGDEDGVSLNIYVSADDIKDLDENTIIYWRIYDADNDKVVDDSKLYNNGGKSYGETPIGLLPEVIPSETNLGEYGYFKRGGSVYFSLAKRLFDLKDGNNYYISVFAWSADFDADNESGWGNPDDKCTVFSPLFVPKAMYLSAEDGEGNAKPSVDATCGNQETSVDLKMALYLPDDSEESGFHKYTDVHFDYFRGTRDEFLAYTLEDDETISLFEAVLNFRGKELRLIEGKDGIYSDPPGKEYSKTAYATSAELPEAYKDVKDGKYYNIIKKAMDERLLYLSCSSDIKLPIDVDHPTILALPTEDYVMYGGERHEVCSPLVFTFDINTTNGGPSLTLGFDDVDYSKIEGYRVVRVGMEQIRNMQDSNNGYLLHIPVNTFKTGSDEEEKNGALEIDGDYLELLPNTSPNLTDDSNVTDNNKKVAKFVGKIVNSDKMYISLNFHDEDVTKQTFYEGFTYHMFFQVKAEGAGDGACEAPVNFLLKVVPEFVTWNDGTTDSPNKNVNWNNDGNWKRSTREELHKSEDETQNTATEAQGGIYKDNAQLNAKLTGNPGFVPMKFTHVTMLSDNHAPQLISLTTTPKDGGKDEGIYTNIGDGATKDIQYDLMVRYTEKTCIDHEISGNVYDCEKFYGNWAKEIYFKPNAELVHQHYLTYEKVWVEKELDANTWTLMSTPLQKTYAGDMYVPKDGRQETEAFKDITFGTGYSRTLYPIYQRSWAQTGSTVYTATNDMYRSDYSANLVGSVTETFTQWSHTYNDVMVDYSTWKGFAIRAHKKEQQDKALLRLPKKDSSYSYYDWNGNSQATDQTDNDNINRDNYGKLFTDDETAPDGRGLTYGVVYDYRTVEGKKEPTTREDGEVIESINEIQSAQGYQLVGNPYLCSINMEKFLSDNSSVLDDTGYWTYENNTVGTHIKGTGNYVKPLQSFFVKLKSDVTTDNIVFNEGMMIDRSSSQPQSVPALTMTASNERGQSSACVMVGEEAKSVETLFDSNLDDVPMVYTVADGQAVSINQLTELRQPIAFGVTCVASDELVEVTFTDVEQLTTDEVRVVDAVTGSQTTISEGSTLTVQPNDYGRYFLLAGTTGIGDKMDVQKGIMVSVRGKEVTVTSGEELTQVRVLTLNGALTYQHTAGGNEASFTLSSGVYIIQAENKAGEQQTVKVVVR